MPNSSRYREVVFVGGRILEAREMLALQTQIVGGRDVNGAVVVRDLNAIYRDGATLNITPQVTANTRTVQLVATDQTKPMQVFVRGRWESLAVSESPAVTLAANQSTLYLNWVLKQVTSADDPSLIDSGTGEAAADMAELVLSVSAVDTSAASLATGQVAKNIVPIVLWNFATSGSTVTGIVSDNVNPEAIATHSKSGPVRLSTDTSGGIAVAIDDPVLTSPRAPGAGTVVDASVRTPVASGTNADNTPKYDLTVDPGGISADKIIWQTMKQRISDVFASFTAKIATIQTAITNHIGGALGQSGTHPFPTATQVGAVPLSHVNMKLGLAGSHPTNIDADSGGFRVDQTQGAGSSTDPAFGIFQNGTYIAGLEHSGDVYSYVASQLTANPLGGSVSGSLGKLGMIARVLAEHVNQHPGNPHAVTADMISAVTQGSGVGQGTNSVKIGWSGSRLKATVDTTDLGNIVFDDELNNGINGEAAARNAAIAAALSGIISVVRNGNGTFVTTTDASGNRVYEAWGIVTAPATGSKYTSTGITFPATFPGVPSVQLLIIGHSGTNDGGSQHAETINGNNVSANGLTAELTCAGEIGGSGSNGFINSVSVHWTAKY